MVYFIHAAITEQLSKINLQQSHVLGFSTYWIYLEHCQPRRMERPLDIEDRCLVQHEGTTLGSQPSR